MKCALITGGSRGIGRAICDKISQDSDYHILINYNSNETAAKETLAIVNANGNTGELLPFNVADAGAVTTALDTWAENNPNAVVEVIVNNAGITRDGLFMWMPSEDWHDEIGRAHV